MANESTFFEDSKGADGLGQAKEFFMAAPVIVGYVKRPDYVIELANPGLLEVWGRGPDVIGLPLTAAIPELQGQGFTELLDEVCETGKPFYAYAYPIRLNRTGTEETYYFDFIYKPYYGAGANQPATGVISVGHDVTSQVKARLLAEQAEAQLQQKVDERTADLQRLVAELANANQNLERFAFAASHDLKAPVRKILLFTQTLYDRLYHSLPDKDQHYLTRILAAGTRMQTLIDDLLDYAQVTSASANFEQVDLNAILNMVKEDLELDIEQRKAIINIDELPILYGNARELQQLFQNLVSNALKYVHPHRVPEIKITCQAAHSADITRELPIANISAAEYFWIKVADNGIGFNQSDAERIFKVFIRLKNKADDTGSGIGLSIVQKVVENHSGYIFATAIQDVGAIFHVLFPRSNSGSNQKN